MTNVGYNLDDNNALVRMYALKSPSKILKRGESLDLKHYSMFDFIKAVVLIVDESYIKIKAKERFVETNFFPGDAVALNIFSQNELYCIEADIVSVEFLDPLEVCIKINNIAKLKDLRKSERYFVSLTSYISLTDSKESKFAIVKNISLGGIKINCRENIKLETVIDVVITLDRLSRLFFKGRIVRKKSIDDYFEYGVEILEILETNLKNLHHFLNQFEFNE